MSDAMDLKRRAKLLRELAQLPCISEEARRRAEFLRRLAEVYERMSEGEGEGVRKNETCGIGANCS